MNFTISFYTKIFFFLLLNVLCSSVVFAQEPLQPGYLISVEGDSIFGLLDLRGKASNAQMIRFRASIEAPEKTFYPKDILGFGTSGGDFFESHLVQVNQSSNKVADLTDAPEPTIGEERYFLQTYVKGLLTMYAFQDDNDNLHIFLQKGDSSPEPLINYKYLKQEREGAKTVNKIKSKRKYLTQLAGFMSDCEEIHSEFLFQKHNDLAWKETDIQALVIRYNQIMGYADLWYLQELKKRSQPQVELGFFIGPAFSQIDFVANGQGTRRAFRTTDFPVETSLAGGLFLHLQSKGNQGRWGFQGELIRHQIITMSRVEDRISESENYIYEMDLDLTYIRLGTAVRYNWPTFSAWKPFGLFGLSTGFLTAETNRLVTTSSNLGIEHTTREPVFREEELLKYELGTMLALGITQKPFIFEAKYEYSYKGFSPVIGVGTPKHSFYLMFGCYL